MADLTRTPKFFIRPNQTNTLNYTWTISPSLVNEAIATVSLDNVYIPLTSPRACTTARNTA